MKNTLYISMVFAVLFLVCGCNTINTAEVPILTDTPLHTLSLTVTPTKLPTLTNTPPQTPTLTNTPTITPKPTNTLIPTPTPIFVTLGSPFAADCGGGIPVIWSNDSFNGPTRMDGFGEDWGHVDWFVPDGCNIDNYDGEVISPVDGNITAYSKGYDLWLTENVYLQGILEALEFAGIENPSLKRISQQRLSFAHMEIITGQVSVGQTLGNVVRAAGHPKIAYQVMLLYDGKEYMLSPTLFPTRLSDGTILRAMLNGNSENWICAANSYANNFQNANNDCIPEKFDYAP